MAKAYEDHIPTYGAGGYDAEHLQQSAAEWHAIHVTEIAGGWRYPEDLLDDSEFRARKYARARYALGLRETDYDG